MDIIIIIIIIMMVEINTWAVVVFRHGAGILWWKESELKNVDRKSRKTMTMYGALHPKSAVDRLYIKSKEGGRGLTSVECCVREEENSLGFYVANSEENLNLSELCSRDNQYGRYFNEWRL